MIEIEDSSRITEYFNTFATYIQEGKYPKNYAEVDALIKQNFTEEQIKTA